LKSKIEILDEKLPNFFYKYVWADNVIKILETKRLWFSSPQDFNDPFDCNVNLIDFTPSNENIEKFINEKVSKNRSVRRQEINKNKRDPYRIKNQMAKQTQDLFYKSGICCFSEVNDNILLWAHYADNHKGICLKFSSDLADIGTMTAKVNYKTGYETANFWTEEGGAIYHLVFTKSDDWSYEKEIRVFRMISKGAIDFDVSNLTQIIFGCKADQSTIEKIKKIVLENNYKHIKFGQARQTKSSFKLFIDNK